MPIFYFFLIKICVFHTTPVMANWLSFWKLMMFRIYSAFLIQRSRNCFSDLSVVSSFTSTGSFFKLQWVWTVFRALDSSVSGCILDSVFCQVPLTWLFKPSRGSNTSFASSILTVVHDFNTLSIRRRTFAFLHSLDHSCLFTQRLRISIFDTYTRTESVAI